MPPISNLTTLLQSMQPVLNDGVYVFSTVPPNTDLRTLDPIGTFREAEGLTVVLAEEQAQQAGLPVLFRAAWITLTVHSDLQAVGLTAAFATALGNANISCNVIAAAFHDHVFVPVELGQAAMAVLWALQRQALSEADITRQTR
ncbi:ACT domain-containing protein [Andreprevotia chitinilytica]|uniref:ACT domain-containing protein n=1 Tax=Andreprevotia chitinilytica TaxID=396808 RepID=UPI00054F15C0|nr:ACT domain-containing protein [Andreprevotia chitinilytica]